MALSFGEQLRIAREQRGVTLREISDHTRIPMRYLEAIENNDYKPLPGGIFNRSFVKKYANYIGFDENEAMLSYSQTAREHGGSPDEVVTTPRVPNVYTDSAATRSPMVTLLLMTVMLAILTLGVYAALHWYQRRSSGANGKLPVPAETQPGVKPANPEPTANATPPLERGDFKIQLKAVGLQIWVETTIDDNKPSSAVLQPGETRDIGPVGKIAIRLAKINTNSLVVTINGKPAKLPFDMNTKLNTTQILVTRDDYATYLQ